MSRVLPFSECREPGRHVTTRTLEADPFRAVQVSLLRETRRAWRRASGTTFRVIIADSFFADDPVKLTAARCPNAMTVRRSASREEFR
jgi:hypothetical protein